jgi:hypothetical protein
VSPAPNRVDWVEAETFFIGLGPTRTFVQVGDRFGVSPEAVGKQARARAWGERARRADAAVASKALTRVVRDRADRIADTIELVDVVRSQLLEQARAGTLDLKIDVMPALAKLESLLEGEPTDRVSTGEVTALLNAFMSRLFRIVKGQHVEEILAAFEQASEAVTRREAGEVLELEAAPAWDEEPVS